MSLPKYGRYRDSGVEWLREIPAHWDLKRLKSCCAVLTSNVDKKAEDGEQSVRLCNYTDVYYNDEITSDLDLMVATASDHQIQKFTLRRGDTVITKDSETADDIARSAFVPSDLPGIVCGYHLAILRPGPQVEGRYVKWLFDSSYIRASCEVRATGLTRVGLSQYDLCNLEVPVPSAEEQSNISEFLTREATKIDHLIAEQQRLIELLKEKRQAVISHAVTKGLNPNAPMKDSGVDWIGTSPSNWTVTKLGFLARIARGASPRPAGDPRYFNGDFMPWITVGDITADSDMYLQQTETMLTADGAEQSRTIPGHTLLLTNSGATLGVPKISTFLACANDGVLAFLDLDPGVDQKFLYFFLSSCTDMLRDRIKQGSGQPNLNTDIVKALPVVLPPADEQIAIVSHLEKEIERFERLSANAAQVIDLLRERRTALISAAVTGKIDVRQAVAEVVA